MRLRRIDAGSFLMGNDRPLPDALLSSSCFRYGDFDEVPVHRVTITRPFYLAECQVTNAQYEMFDPAHRDQHLLHCISPEMRRAQGGA